MNLTISGVICPLMWHQWGPSTAHWIKLSVHEMIDELGMKKQV